MHRTETSRGYFLGLSAYLMWGLFPLYLHVLAELQLSPLEVMAIRFIWGAFFSLTTLLIWRRKGWIADLMAHPSHLATLALSGTLVSSTQLIYIWAMNHGMLIEASLGYFVLPLLNVLFGSALLKERPTSIQWLCVILATIGVLQQFIQLGTLPWVSFLLALTFSLYGLIRKRAPIAVLPGLCVENFMLAPFAIVWLALNPESISTSKELWSTIDVLWIIGIGPVTLLPLICFNMATRKFPYSTIGFLQ
jgi:chloramphenicol-sensitive protein RarD